jgi:hypothetical protein
MPEDVHTLVQEVLGGGGDADVLEYIIGVSVGQGACCICVWSFSLPPQHLPPTTACSSLSPFWVHDLTTSKACCLTNTMSMETMEKGRMST